MRGLTGARRSSMSLWRGDTTTLYFAAHDLTPRRTTSLQDEKRQYPWDLIGCRKFDDALVFRNIFSFQPTRWAVHSRTPLLGQRHLAGGSKQKKRHANKSYREPSHSPDFVKVALIVFFN